MTVALVALPQFFDDAGNPLSGGKVFTYAAGTLTPLASYTDRGGGTPNNNPVVLDSSGRADIWLSTNVAYKLIVKDSTEATTYDSVDDYYAGADPSQLVAAGIVPATGGTYTGPVSFTGGVTVDGTAAQDLATLDSLNIAAVETANLWINPDAAIWQRDTPSVADGNYGFDRIVNLCETGSTTLSQLTTPADGIPYAMRSTQPDAVAKRIGFLQIVEAKNCLSYRGKNLAFALKVRCSASTTVRCALVAWTGTTDSPTRDVVNNWASTTYTAGNFFVANTSTIAVAATAVTAATWTDVLVSSASAGGVVVPSTMNNLYMVVWTDATQAQNVTLDASLMRCGQGTVAPLWTPPNAALELTKCKRYLPAYKATQATEPVATGQCTGAVSAFIFFRFDVEPRAVVSGVVATSGYYLTTAAGAATASLSTFTFSASSKLGALCSATVPAGLVAGNATLLSNLSGTGLIYFTGAEL
jgi:hypothetical protein